MPHPSPRLAAVGSVLLALLCSACGSHLSHRELAGANGSLVDLRTGASAARASAEVASGDIGASTEGVTSVGASRSDVAPTGAAPGPPPAAGSPSGRGRTSSRASLGGLPGA